MAGEILTGQQVDTAATLALVSRLHHQRRLRDESSLFFVEGIRNFLTAVQAGFTVDTLIYSERLLTVAPARQLVRRLKRDGVPCARITPEQFRQISTAERAAGVAAILRQRTFDLSQIDPSGDLCWVGLKEVRSPGNFGSLMRTAAAASAAGFVLLDDAVDPYDPGAVRGSMGAVFRQRMVRADAELLERWIRRHGVQVIGASPDGTVAYDRVRYQPPVLLMLGEERSGLAPVQRALCDQIVRIPMVDDVDSLNLAVAGSLLLYEVYRASRKQEARGERLEGR